MTHKQIEEYRVRLNTLTESTIGQPTEEASGQENQMRPELEKLAHEVGASMLTGIIDKNGKYVWRKGNSSDLIRNIHQALQTASMICMARTANRNFLIAIVAAIAAVASALAAWAAVGASN